MGRWLRDKGYVPDVVLCSTARRTRDTWALMAGELGAEPPVRYEQRIYEATALSLLHLLREAGGEHQTVLLIGHNPGLIELAVGIAQMVDGPAADRWTGSGRSSLPPRSPYWTSTGSGPT